MAIEWDVNMFSMRARISRTYPEKITARQPSQDSGPEFVEETSEKFHAEPENVDNSKLIPCVQRQAGKFNVQYWILL